MYRLVLYYLIALVLIASGLSAFNILSFDPLAVVASATYLTAICWLANKLFAYVFKSPANIESPLITALILSLIISPQNSVHNIAILSVAGILAISSKYIIAINGRHIFNPAALAILLMAYGPREPASWWIGSTAMLPYVLIGGLLVVRKIQRGTMVGSFLFAALACSVAVSLISSSSPVENLQKTLLHSSLLFLAFVMLTEPATSPNTKNKQIVYGALTGLLFPPQLHLAGIYSTPELALIVGNIYSYLVSPKIKLTTALTRKLSTGPSSRDFIFELKNPLDFKPGQYMEWTLPHKNADSRGNRRYFTIASSPTENNLRLGVKFYPKSSSFKKALFSLDQTTPLIVSQLSGDFILPEDKGERLVFIAGGIGITPFRSMLKYLIDTDQRRNIVLLYSEKNPESFVYKDILDEAEKRLGVKPIYTVTDPPAGGRWPGRTGVISEEMITSEIANYEERMYYISGPQPMVKNVQQILYSLGVPRHKIKIDFFPGYI